MFAEEIRRQAEVAPQAALSAVTAALWRAYGEGKITEAEAEALSGLIETRTISAPRRGENLSSSRVLNSPNPATSNVGTAHITGPHSPQPVASLDTAGAPQNSTKRSVVGSRPRTDASLERRRRWAASGRLPPGLAAQFTLAEQAVLALVAAETARRKDCRLSIENMAAVAGVCRSTVKNAIREARRLELLTVEERAITGFRNDTNVLRIVSPEWLAWIRLARRGNPLSNMREQPAPSVHRGGGVKSVTSTHTEVLTLSESGKTEPSECCRRAAGDLNRSDPTRIRAGRGTGRVMR
ncbi:helix-turn-helix domain-containing protein (plasmid) [Methylobacterium fujisawaense]|uniref:helix-turn-helix domain-containing protein n=1 Tax=Methylobacterium fujisawaense TaxID=107400 RepID=UPI0009F86AC9